ncbi:alkaline exonuclease [Apocheima cinerarium nucleopolyhedrovirus]|uniref:alkaline exonuclease n=1 Tax=Apocheima cinerarium nucleopolyhedrovirus TaxID=307461 RepID=UPI0001D92045|nr:alkaline exonuclease [Apocheima cinerarium nucleopolyhedrovirus]ADB84377.1 alkaline exonuclease [Apocheima cinerarium nucleopolyhedrovirus]
MAELTREQEDILHKFIYTNYVKNLKNVWQHLTRKDILHIEKCTRGQSTNPLWNILRLDRRTASNSSTNMCEVPPTAAMSYGITQETLLKENVELIESIVKCIEKTLKTRIVESVLDCGMFFTQLGLSAASPDAYFVTKENVFIPMEIKCPISYENISVEEMRNSLNTRKPRYRVKHTALSVNKTGPPLFVVEKTDPHYRQMQRQMYVLDSPICIYVVKFKNSYVASVVNRDEKFCKQEKQNEQKMFNIYVARNTIDKKLLDYDKRLESFKNQIHMYKNEEVRMLVTAGLYYRYGELLCAFCKSIFDSDTACNTILQKHGYVCIKDTSVTNMVTYKYTDYFDHSKRVKSLQNAKANVEYAAQGLFYDIGEKSFKTFCCGQDNVHIIDHVKHSDSCSYIKLIK